jgi:hypothetical protein
MSMSVTLPGPSRSALGLREYSPTNSSKSLKDPSSVASPVSVFT